MMHAQLFNADDAYVCVQSVRTHPGAQRRSPAQNEPVCADQSRWSFCFGHHVHAHRDQVRNHIIMIHQRYCSSSSSAVIAHLYHNSVFLLLLLLNLIYLCIRLYLFLMGTYVIFTICDFYCRMNPECEPFFGSSGNLIEFTRRNRF